MKKKKTLRIVIICAAIAATACITLAACLWLIPLITAPKESTGVWASILCNEYGHAFEGATCTEDGACRRCEAVGGMLPHGFSAVTCVAGEVCAACGAEGKAALGHEFVGATCTTPAVCTRCEATGEMLPHDFAAATCETAETCTACGAAGATGALGHAFTEATCTTDSICTRCGVIGSYALGHDYAGGGWATVCLRCGYVEFYPELMPDIPGPQYAGPRW